jgi:hypothetical protein
MKAFIHLEMTVQEVIEHWPATRAVFERHGIPTQTAPVPVWETIEAAAAAHGHWATDQLIGELNHAAGGQADIQPDIPIAELARAYPATQAVLDRYAIPYQANRGAHWETIEQAAATRGHWATDTLLDDLNAVL